MNGFDKDNLKTTSEKILEIVSENDEGINCGRFEVKRKSSDLLTYLLIFDN